MEAHHHQKNRENDVEKPIELAAAAAATSLSQSSSSSASSSPSHEFSFTISHHSSFSTPFPAGSNKSKPPNNSSLAPDLSPADEIFFHGHLLPLQILSHFPSSSSPRSSTNSSDSFTLPIRELLQQSQYQNPTKNSVSSSSNSNSNSSSNITSESKRERENNNFGTKKVDGKSKFGFLSFGVTKEHKGCHNVKDKEKNKKQFDVIHAVKIKYLRMVKTLRLFRGQREKVRGFHDGKSYSYSGNVTPRKNDNKNKQEFKGTTTWRGQFSAPASMKTSPSNSGVLLPHPPPSDSTMEELQAAIQAAIAHCKNSFASSNAD